MAFLNFIVPICLMAFGRKDQIFCGWVVLLIVVINTIYYLFTSNVIGVHNINEMDVIIVAVSAIAAISIAIISNYIWTFIFSAVLFVRETFIFLAFIGVSFQKDIFEYLFFASFLCVLTLVLLEELANLFTNWRQIRNA